MLLYNIQGIALLAGNMAASITLLCPWNSPGKNTGVGSHSLLHGIFLTPASNLGLLHGRWILYCLSHQGSSITFGHSNSTFRLLHQSGQAGLFCGNKKVRNFTVLEQKVFSSVCTHVYQKIWSSQIRYVMNITLDEHYNMDEHYKHNVE